MEHTKPKATPMDFFLWLGAMAALYVSAVSFITLLFEYIEVAFPDDLSGFVDPFSGAIRFAIASLVVLFPLYLYLTRRLNQDIRRNPGKKEIWVRRWLIWITLFVAGITLVVDLITLINFFLGGDLTARFVLKVVTVFVVIGGIFLYYVYDLKGYWESHERRAKAIGGIVAFVVFASIVSGFFIIGSPETQRELRLDQERVQDLQSIQSAVVRYWQDKGSLPDELAMVEDPLVGFSAPTDPVTGEAYTYRKTSARVFEICATFAHPSPGTGVESPRPVSFDGFGGSFEHGAGEACFEREIDPERFPVRKGE